VLGQKKRKGHAPRPQPRPIRYPIAVLIRMFLLGSVAVIAAAWAIWRHYTIPPAPMLVPVAPAPPASEIEIEPPP